MTDRLEPLPGPPGITTVIWQPIHDADKLEAGVTAVRRYFFWVGALLLIVYFLALSTRDLPFRVGELLAVPPLGTFYLFVMWTVRRKVKQLAAAQYSSEGLRTIGRDGRAGVFVRWNQISGVRREGYVLNVSSTHGTVGIHLGSIAEKPEDFEILRSYLRRFITID